MQKKLLGCPALFTLLQLFAQFDLKRNNIIDFGEFVRSLSVFHPKAPLEEKAECEQTSWACYDPSGHMRCDMLGNAPWLLPIRRHAEFGRVLMRF